MPAWVIDYVLVHELAHLLERKHTKAFWKMVDRYPKAERAKGYLEGVAQAATPRGRPPRRRRGQRGLIPWLIPGWSPG